MAASAAVKKKTPARKAINRHPINVAVPTKLYRDARRQMKRKGDTVRAVFTEALRLYNSGMLEIGH